MATYDPKQVLTDYAAGRITPEMAVGHSLQHIDKLYEICKTNQQTCQNKAVADDKRFALLQAAVDRLTAFVEKVRAKQKPPAPSQHKPDQP